MRVLLLRFQVRHLLCVVATLAYRGAIALTPAVPAAPPRDSSRYQVALHFSFFDGAPVDAIEASQIDGLTDHLLSNSQRRLSLSKEGLS